MADQPSLRLEADQLPDLPDLRVMLPRPLRSRSTRTSTSSSRGGAASGRWGRRTSPGWAEVRIVDAAGGDLTSAFPELAGLAVRLAARSAILDGELVVVDASGRADARGGHNFLRLSGKPGAPAAFLAFDLLHLDGRSLLSQPLIRRREALRRVLRPGDEVVAVPAIATEGIALSEAAVARGNREVCSHASDREARTCLACKVGCGGSLPRSLPGTAKICGKWGRCGRGKPGKELAVAVAASAPVLALINRLPLREGF